MSQLRIMLSIICAMIVSNTFTGQTVLLHEKISTYDFEIPKSGPNFRHFNHLYIGLAFFVPSNVENEVETKYGSALFSVGWRYKLKLTKWLAIGTGINYTNEVFDIKQNENKVVPNDIVHSKEKLRFNNLGTDVFFRFNFGKRGNVIGRFIDIGAYGNWAFNVKNEYTDQTNNANPPNYAGKERVILTGLNYIEKFNYGLKCRIGINRFVLVGSYRLSDLLTNEYKELVGDYFFPRLAFGLEVGLHK